MTVSLKENDWYFVTDQTHHTCFFAYWLTAYFGWIFANYRNSPFYWATYLRGKSYVLILIKNALGYIMAIFSKNASGHPAYGLLFTQSTIFCCTVLYNSVQHS
jgi:hypothetical protein